MRFRVWFVAENFLRTHIPSLAVEIPDLEPEIRAFHDFPAQRGGAFFMDRVMPTPGTERILDRLEEGLRLVKRAAGSVPVAVLILPMPGHCDDALHRGEIESVGLPAGEYERGMLQRHVSARCARLGLEVYDLTEALARVEEIEAAFLPDGAHLSVHGHVVIAEHLAAVLAKRDW